MEQRKTIKKEEEKLLTEGFFRLLFDLEDKKLTGEIKKRGLEGLYFAGWRLYWDNEQQEWVCEDEYFKLKNVGTSHWVVALKWASDLLNKATATSRNVSDGTATTQEIEEWRFIVEYFR